MREKIKDERENERRENEREDQGIKRKLIRIEMKRDDRKIFKFLNPQTR